MDSLSWVWPQVKPDVCWPLQEVLLHYCPSTSFRQEGGRSRVLWLVSSFLLPQLLEYLLTPERLYSVEVKADGRHQLDLSLINELCGCCPRQSGPTVNFQGASLYPSISLGCLNISVGPPPQSATQKTATHSYHWNCCMATKMSSSGSISSVTRSPH